MTGGSDVATSGQPVPDPELAGITTHLKILEWRMSRMEVGVSMALAKLGLTLPDMPFHGTAVANAPAPTAPAGPVVKNGPYQYRPLDPNKSEVRILKLIGGGKETDPIECSLLHIDFDHAGNASHGDPDFAALSQFIALSYTWGEPKFEESILMDGHSFPVTKNLKDALVRLRTTPRPGINLPYKAEQPTVSYWWIDAVCVNQADVDERNAQVLLMRRIYHKASMVRIWLGEEAADSDRAFRVVDDLDKPLPSRGPGITEPEPLVVDDSERRKNWAALAALFARPWWRRVWVRQEVALNTQIVVSCGGASCYFYVLVAAAKKMNTLALETGLDLEPGAIPQSGDVMWCNPAEDLNILQSQTSYGRQFADLAPLLLQGRTCEATDPRDRVFALLGLADPQVYGLVPDYRLLLRQVIIDATKAVMFTTSKLDLFAAAQNPTRQNGLPSWAPNVVDPWKSWPLPEKDGWSPTMKTTAPMVNFGGSEGQETLTLRGFRCDIIALFSSATVRNDDSIDTLHSTYRRWKNFSHRREYVDKQFGAYQHSMRYELLAPRNDREWLEFVSIRTDSQWFDYAADDSLMGPREQAGSSIRGPVDDRPRTYLVPSDGGGGTANPCARIHVAMRKYAAGRQLGFSTNGCLGLFPEDAQVGDLIVGFPGAFHPVILRAEGDGFVLVGQACK
ncbi:heterokaryon incompatibility protein-domain-containing protein [Staphylotrichum tortipilum]|uniref:Heterokaryon incompatibility protein-domain-containing protein n=1 Tax=Staphylotrichum tortipilum TaxID=2831512 RepID=A0AAN6MKE3_9PEZI|nr:heterokaryon incompatibility protein-domain-containing protein [Staphylotrichum longicolle]